MSAEPANSNRDTFELRWRERFREFAEHHDDDAGIAGWSGTGLAARLRRFSTLWKDSGPHGRWLDAGCGAGTYTRLLHEAGHEVVSVDYLLLTVQKALSRDQAAADYIVGDVRALPLAARAFDGVLCFGVLQALSESEPALRELARVVRPGGELWIDALNARCVVHAAELLGRKARGRPIHLRYEAPSRLRKSIEALGFESVRVHWLPILPGSWPRLQEMIESAIGRWMLKTLPFVGLLGSHSFIVHARKWR